MMNESTLLNLLASTAHIRKALRHDHVAIAPRFNIFEILGVAEREAPTHSAFLANLLNPAGTHAQGGLFINAFFKEIGHPEFSDVDDWTVYTELPFLGGRLDIVLQSRTGSSIIVIENKIGTADSPDQLSKYSGWLEKPERKRLFKSRRLLYLTLHGDKPKCSSEVPCETISYKENIHRWLDAIEPASPKVRETVKTYCQTIINLTSSVIMTDNIDQNFLKIIDTPEQRANALRIVRLGPQIKDDVLNSFWNDGQRYLKEKLSDQRYKFWTLKEKYDDGGSSCGLPIAPHMANFSRPHFAFWFNQYWKPPIFRWEICVKFDNWIGHDLSQLSSATSVKASLESHSMRGKRGWDGYKVVTEDKNGIERCLEEEILDKAYTRALFQEGWDLFASMEPEFQVMASEIMKSVR